MPGTYIIGFILLLQLAGCAVNRTETAGAAPQGGTVVVERLPPAALEPGAAMRPLSIDSPGGSVIIERLPPLPEVVPEVPIASAPPVVPVAPAAVLPAAPAKPAVPPPVIPAPAATTAAPDKAATGKASAKPPVKPAAPATVRAALPQKPGAATLDLDALEKRLKDTDAIGVFTKIALKNQVDELLKRFKAYHESDGRTTLAQLRQSYDQLLLKVNDVLKNGDPALAGEIMGSREAIWSLLSDPVKFAKL